MSMRYLNLDVRLQMDMYCDVHSTELVEHIWKKRLKVRDGRKNRMVDHTFLGVLQSAGTVHGSRTSTDEHLVGPNPRCVSFQHTFHTRADRSPASPATAQTHNEDREGSQDVRELSRLRL